jgi:Holliday junction resolvase RusA-like endonuclease
MSDFCEYEDCDQKAIYCPGHAAELQADEAMKFNLLAPPSANRIWRVSHNRVHKSPLYKMWLDDEGYHARSQFGRECPHEPLEGDISVALVVRPSDKRLRDIDNYCKPILDLLQHAGIIKNDQSVVSLSVVRGPMALTHHVEVSFWCVPTSTSTDA